MSNRNAHRCRKDIPHGNKKYDAETVKEWRKIKKENNFNMKELALYLDINYNVMQRVMSEL